MITRRKLLRHFWRWLLALVALPSGCTIGLGVIPGLQLLALLPLYFLLGPPGCTFGSPHFKATEVGVYPDSWLGAGLVVLFWVGLCLALAAVSAATVGERNSEPEPAPPRHEPPKKAAAPVLALVCPACRATNVAGAACFRCGTPLTSPS